MARFGFHLVPHCQLRRPAAQFRRRRGIIPVTAASQPLSERIDALANRVPVNLPFVVRAIHLPVPAIRLHVHHVR